MKTEYQKTIDDFIRQFPQDVQIVLQKVRETIKAVAPEATESISYGIPTFQFHGNLVHFAGYAHHIGFYPGSEGVEHFRDELTGYKTSKGTIQFPLDKPIPFDLIRRITEFRVEKNLNKVKKKA
jgi:uncharacterized protein YdhG (YjbR/CyaY superfamily)